MIEGPIGHPGVVIPVLVSPWYIRHHIFRGSPWFRMGARAWCPVTEQPIFGVAAMIYHGESVCLNCGHLAAAIPMYFGDEW